MLLIVRPAVLNTHRGDLCLTLINRENHFNISVFPVKGLSLLCGIILIPVFKPQLCKTRDHMMGNWRGA